jgi:FtsH-binding integral membrane protein
MMGYVCIAGLVLMVFGLVAIMASVFFHTRLLYLIYAGLAALLFMFYLAIDIQMIMGGRKLELSPEEHIFVGFTKTLSCS